MASDRTETTRNKGQTKGRRCAELHPSTAIAGIVQAGQSVTPEVGEGDGVLSPEAPSMHEYLRLVRLGLDRIRGRDRVQSL